MVSEATASTSLAGSEPRRSTRSRTTVVSQLQRTRKTHTPRGPGVKRKVVEDLDDSEEELPQKRLKLTIKINTQSVARISHRNSITAARNRFLLHHRSIFEPLLPIKSNLFTTLEEAVDTTPKNRKISEDATNYTPHHALDGQPSRIVNGEMKDYQLAGLSFMAWHYENGMNCILGDEMGLGKTLQSISLLAYVNDKRIKCDPHLIICPLSVLSSWATELARWTPSFKVIQFHGSASERERLKGEILRASFDVLITTYGSYKAENGWFKSRHWTYCILDEGHSIKNAETDVAKTLQGLGSQYRLLLTGTPVQNNVLELWSLLHWLYPTIFTEATAHRFRSAFDVAQGKFDLDFLKHCQNLLSVIMLRRTKQVVDISIPPREELVVRLPLTPLQRFWYKRLLTRTDTMTLQEIFSSTVKKEEPTGDDAHAPGMTAEMRTRIDEEMRRPQKNEKNNNQWQKLMNLMMQLRKVCNSPYILSHAAPDPYELGEHVIAASSKLLFIDKLLAKILPTGDRVLIFSEFTSMLDCLEDFCAWREIPIARLDGSVCRPRRTFDIKLFQQEKSPYQVYLISTKAGGLGINLTKATHVVMADSSWNPHVDLQAIARAHRIGQKKTVKVYRLVCQDSIEDQILSILAKKLYLSTKVMTVEGQSNTAQSGPSLGTNDMLNILRGGSAALAGRWSSADGSIDNGFETFMAATIEEVLEHSRAKADVKEEILKRDIAKLELAEPPIGTAPLAVKKEDDNTEDNPLPTPTAAIEAEEEFLRSGVFRVKTALFEDKVHVAKSFDKMRAEQSEILDKRERKGRLVKVNGIHHVATPDKANAVIKPPQPTRKRKTFEHEPWCIYCQDGGEVMDCTRCPRIFHPECAGIMTRAAIKALFMPTCPQHSCWECDRGTNQTGGMLFRCQSCPRAFCEDCLPPGELESIGDELPEFVELGYGKTSQAHYIRCAHCIQEAGDD